MSSQWNICKNKVLKLWIWKTLKHDFAAEWHHFKSLWGLIQVKKGEIWKCNCYVNAVGCSKISFKSWSLWNYFWSFNFSLWNWSIRIVPALKITNRIKFSLQHMPDKVNLSFTFAWQLKRKLDFKYNFIISALDFIEGFGFMQSAEIENLSWIESDCSGSVKV